ncbi:hypothetical protein PGIGA_G00115070 [Pangasianodon gigas]|uniref:Uncharacterized protein n=1 Tax=Pangasianodon gigas TaxID=30993 RepID=A0ACC5WAL5_PANGG|nr:hypothetical protein [Pangasianodon gigas]
MCLLELVTRVNAPCILLVVKPTSAAVRGSNSANNVALNGAFFLKNDVGRKKKRSQGETGVLVVKRPFLYVGPSED